MATNGMDNGNALGAGDRSKLPEPKDIEGAPYMYVGGQKVTLPDINRMELQFKDMNRMFSDRC